MRYFFFTFLLLIAHLTKAQIGEVFGFIKDSKTNEVLPFVNVFLNNTTIGTATDIHGGFLLQNVPVGTYEIVFSFVGYQTYQAKISVQHNSKLNKSIFLTPSETELSEVHIVGSRDKIWERQLKRFKKAFLGEGRNARECSIKNPEVLDFEEKSGSLIATASNVIQIENDALGYKINFYLKSFACSETVFSIVGNTHFSELNPKDEAQYNYWEKNRENAYVGSLVHFLKSVAEKKISHEGFKVYEENAMRSDNFELNLSKGSVVPYDTQSMVFRKGIADESSISLKGKIEIHYLKKWSRLNSYLDLNHSVSWINVKGGIIRIDNNGRLLNPSDIVVSGDMFVDRVADMLPINYSKDRGGNGGTRQTQQIHPLQEKVYIATDKPYYYSSEIIWFSGFINYSNQSLEGKVSQVLYVDLIDTARIISSVTIKIDSGRAIGNLKIPEAIPGGKYVMRAYTKWMIRNGVESFFYKPIPILLPHQRIEIENQANLKNDGNLDIEFDKDKYRLREEVKMKLKVIDESNNPMKATMAISVVDTYQVSAIKDEPTILNCYHLEESATKLRDSKSSSSEIEKGISLIGTCYRSGKISKNIKLTIIQDKLEGIYQTETDKYGNFSIPNLSFYDSVNFAFQFKGDKVVLESNTTPPLLNHLPFYNLKFSVSDSLYKANRVNFESDITLLDEIEVKSSRINTSKKQESLYGKPDWYVSSKSLEQLNTNLASAIEMKLLGQFVLTSRNGHLFMVYARGASLHMKSPGEFIPEPVLFIDNIQFFSSGETVGDRLYNMNTNLIDHIEVSAMNNSQMGATGSNGAIWVFTKKGIDENQNFKSLPIVKVKGFDRPLVFLSPSLTSSVPDYRATIYWNPKADINFSKDVNELTFFTSDLPGRYKVVAEGVTETGKPIRIEKQFEVVEK